MIPEVSWRFGERYLATDFCQAKNVAIVNQANLLEGGDFINSVAMWIRDFFYYPLDNSGNPAAQGQMLRHQKGIVSGYHAKKCVYYMWSLPNEILGFTMCGICIDTANLAGSILRAKGIDAWITLGDVMSTKDNNLLGRHAWVEVPYNDKIYVLETTIHEPNTLNMVEAEKVYDKNSDWAIKGGVYFVYQAKYNEVEFKGEGPLGAEIIPLFGLPAHSVQLWGKERTLHRNNRKLVKEWRAEERMITNLLKEAYRRL